MEEGVLEWHRGCTNNRDAGDDSGDKIRVALPLTALLFPLLGISLATAIAHTATTHKDGWQFGMLTGASFIPILNINAGNIVPQPASQSVFLLFLAVYSLLLVIQTSFFSQPGKRKWSCVVFLLTSVSVLFYHPMRPSTSSISSWEGIAALLIARH